MFINISNQGSKVINKFYYFYNPLGTIAVQQSSIVKNIKCTERICICIYLFLLIGIIAILSIKNTPSNNAGFEGIINIINKPTSSIYNSSSSSRSGLGKIQHSRSVVVSCGWFCSTPVQVRSSKDKTHTLHSLIGSSKRIYHSCISCFSFNSFVWLNFLNKK